jgi:glycosyltransferase involved in cell wall biosynthesis
MPSTDPRLVVIDQSLKGFDGHHYEYDLAVLKAAAKLDLQTMLATHRDFPGDLLGSTPTVRRFAETWNDARHSNARAFARRALATIPDSLRHLLLRAATILPSSPPPASVKPALQFGTTLSDIIVAEALGERDHVLIHTLSESELLGLSASLGNHARLPHLHVVLRYDGMPIFREAVVAIRNNSLLARHFNFWTDTEQLAAHYRELGIPKIGILPIPHCLPELTPERARDSTEPLTLAYLGGARGDKGYGLLPGLVEALAKDYLATRRARFLIQSNYGLSFDEPQIAKARDSLSRFQRGWIQLVEGPLDTTAFQAALFSADILLLPYRADIYRRRSSGLLVQAAAVGIPTVVPDDTWLNTEAPPGAHVTFRTPTSLAEATRTAIENYHSLLAAARAAAPDVRRKHDAVRLVRMIVEVGAHCSS